MKRLTFFFHCSLLVTVFTTSLLTDQSKKSAQFATLCVQKNELSLLSFWLAYHVEIFGVKNVGVLDNFSTDNRTLKILDYWSKKGVRVLYNQGPYLDKGELTVKGFRKLFPAVDVAVPLDADEMLSSFRNGVPIPRGSVVREDLETFKASRFPCMGLKPYFSSTITLANGTVDQSEYFRPLEYSANVCKKMAKMKYLTDLDHGNHHLKMNSNFTSINCTYSSQSFGLGILHYSKNGPELQFQKALMDCIGLGILPPTVTAYNLKSFSALLESKRKAVEQHNIAGWHKLKRVIKVYDFGLQTSTQARSTKGLVHLGNFSEILRMSKT